MISILLQSTVISISGDPSLNNSQIIPQIHLKRAKKLKLKDLYLSVLCNQVEVNYLNKIA